jgi:hypothetical protein
MTNGLLTLGERVDTPYGSGIIVGFGRARAGWEGVWQVDIVDPTLGPVRVVGTKGPFVVVLIEDRTISVLYDEINPLRRDIE